MRYDFHTYVIFTYGKNSFWATTGKVSTGQSFRFFANASVFCWMALIQLFVKIRWSHIFYVTSRIGFNNCCDSVLVVSCSSPGTTDYTYLFRHQRSGILLGLPLPIIWKRTKWRWVSFSAYRSCVVGYFSHFAILSAADVFFWPNSRFRIAAVGEGGPLFHDGCAAFRSSMFTSWRGFRRLRRLKRDLDRSHLQRTLRDSISSFCYRTFYSILAEHILSQVTS